MRDLIGLADITPDIVDRARELREVYAEAWRDVLRDELLGRNLRLPEHWTPALDRLERLSGEEARDGRERH